MNDNWFIVTLLVLQLGNCIRCTDFSSWRILKQTVFALTVTAVARAFVSHRCGPGLIHRPGVICGWINWLFVPVLSIMEKWMKSHSVDILLQIPIFYHYHFVMGCLWNNCMLYMTQYWDPCSLNSRRDISGGRMREVLINCTRLFSIVICHQSRYFTISVEDISRNGWTWTNEEENLPLLTEHTSQFSSRLRHSITATPKIVEASLLVQICVRFTNAQIEANFTSKFRCHANVKRSQRYLIFNLLKLIPFRRMFVVIYFCWQGWGLCHLYINSRWLWTLDFFKTMFLAD